MLLLGLPVSPSKPLLRALAGHVQDIPPIWLMRQAGRYLPEYRALRAKAPSFLDFCYRPDWAVEVTLQPIRRFGLDAAILFSDILVVPDALGQKVSFETGEGPRLDPIEDKQAFDRLRTDLDFHRLAPVFETLERVKQHLPDAVALIGFCGAPWTVASYMVAGRSTQDQAPARLMAYHQRDLFQRVIDRLTDVSIEYLVRQLRAGADVVQIFDSWAGILPMAEWERWCLAPLEKIVQGVRAQVPEAPILAFVRGSEGRFGHLAQMAGLSGLGMDIPVDVARARQQVPPTLALQGNIDPLVLLAGGEVLDQAVDRVRYECRGHPHIMNLGHGIVPQTPPEHVSRLVARVRSASIF